MKYASTARARHTLKKPGAPYGRTLFGWAQAVISGLLLVGCATAPPASQIVRVPVYVPCVTGAPLPAPVFEFGKLSATASDGDKILALARDWPRGREYEGLLEAVVAGCR